MNSRGWPDGDNLHHPPTRPPLTKNQIEAKEYKRLRRLHLTQHPFCAICGDTATLVHHKITRRTHLIDTTVFESRCAPCERRFHEAEHAEKKRARKLARHMRIGRMAVCANGCPGIASRYDIYHFDHHVGLRWLCPKCRQHISTMKNYRVTP